VQLHAGDIGDEAVGQHRGQPAVDERVLAVLAPARHHAQSFFSISSISRGMSAGSFCRSASSVTITSWLRRVDAGAHGGGLAEVAAEADQAEMGVAGGRLDQALPGAVARAVVHQEDLVGAPDAGQRVVEFLRARVATLGSSL
jgi:hypothetical protein